MLRRVGNFGFIDTGGGDVYSFSIGAAAKGWTPSSFMMRGGVVNGLEYMNAGGVNVIPYGHDNDLPGYVRRLLERFYAGEGIMSKKTGLQWGEGPRLYMDAVDESNVLYRSWQVGEEADAILSQSDMVTQMHRCLVDLVHLEGFWVRITRTRGTRIGTGSLASIEHVPASKVRFVWPGPGAKPTHAMLADFPVIDPKTAEVLPLFDPQNPLKHASSLAYYRLYSFGHDHYSVPRYVGAFDWLELAGSLGPLLTTYLANASAVSKHIESPKSYWDDQEAFIKSECERRSVAYSAKMLEDFKDEAMEAFAATLSGKENAGKFLHTSSFWNPEANAFEGWKIVPIDNKLKEYIEALVLASKKAEAAATSGFGLDPSLSNLILDTKLGSGSEKLYALKVYNATETSLIDTTLCRPFQQFIDVNNPGSGLKIGLYRTVVEAEKNVSPSNRMKANA